MSTIHFEAWVARIVNGELAGWLKEKLRGRRMAPSTIRWIFMPIMLDAAKALEPGELGVICAYGKNFDDHEVPGVARGVFAKNWAPVLHNQIFLLAEDSGIAHLRKIAAATMLECAAGILGVGELTPKDIFPQKVGDEYEEENKKNRREYTAIQERYQAIKWE